MDTHRSRCAAMPAPARRCNPAAGRPGDSGPPPSRWRMAPSGARVESLGRIHALPVPAAPVVARQQARVAMQQLGRDEVPVVMPPRLVARGSAEGGEVALVDGGDAFGSRAALSGGTSRPQ